MTSRSPTLLDTSHRALPARVDVAIVGAGPSGLAAATTLKQSGVRRVIVLEREPTPGGIPRHCGHPPFGMREFARCMKGPAYAAALARRACAAGVDLRTNVSVVRIAANGELLLSANSGAKVLHARRVVLCTGVRETPRAPRLVTGSRPLGVLTTGALQSMVYLQKRIPFRHPLIVGTELVSFSALLTARHAGITPRAMLESNAYITARPFARILPTLLGVPILRETELVAIHGNERVTGTTVRDSFGETRHIACDGVIFSGRFTPEASLARAAHLRIDPATGGPVIDQFGRCSDPAYFAAGNLLRPVETAGWCWNEGRRTAQNVLRSLADALPPRDRVVTITRVDPILLYAVPQVFCPSDVRDSVEDIQLRFSKREWGQLTVEQNAETVWQRSLQAVPERRVLVPACAVISSSERASVTIRFTRP